MINEYLLGPITQLLTMNGLPINGPLADTQLEILPEAGVVIRDGLISEIGTYTEIAKRQIPRHEISTPTVVLPGFIDAHTHLCFAGSRAKDYAQRLNGLTYQEIAAQGGGIQDTVRHTRAASAQELEALLRAKIERLIQWGVTTCEVKSGYGLSIDEEIKILEVIDRVGKSQPVTLVPTCLAAHVRPPEFQSNQEYLAYLIQGLLPQLIQRGLTRRIDIFVEQGAFSRDEALAYLNEAKRMGFDLCIHADQFSRGGALLAAEVGALTADHLEQSIEEDFLALTKRGTIPVVLPGASIGLGIPYPHARQILDLGLPLVIASDWNPGSAPMGHLLAEAALLGMAEKLTMAETLAALTVRAARALRLNDRGCLKDGKRADIIGFPTGNYQDILYHQGSLQPSLVYAGGQHLL